MRRELLLVLLLLTGCPKSNETATTASEAGLATTASVAIATITPAASSAPLVDAGRTPPKKLTAREVVDRWNDAHAKHDGTALEALYGAKVKFYGQTLTGKDCAARKVAAFKKSPDYAQAIKDVTSTTSGPATTFSFTKTSTEKGKSTDYPSVLVVVGETITAETDKITEANLVAKDAVGTEWCLDSQLHVPNVVVRAPYKLSAAEAYQRARLAKHFKDQETSHAGKFIDYGQFGCPVNCNTAKGECRFDMRLEDHSSDFDSMIEWVWVDAVTGVLFWNDGKNSEPLPPMPIAP